MDLKKAGWEGVDWIHLAQDRLVLGCCEHPDIPALIIDTGRLVIHPLHYCS
jgi:hypothetical protein